jgi:hypothetical protein
MLLRPSGNRLATRFNPKLVAKRTGHKVGLDTATRMAQDADQKPSDPRSREPSFSGRPFERIEAHSLWEVTRRAVSVVARADA